MRAVYDGWDGIWEYCINWYDQWDEYDFEPVKLLDANDSVLAVLRERGRMQASDIEIAQEFSHSFVLRDGRIIEWRMYDTHEQALEAVGLRA